MQAEFYTERLHNLITHNALLTANAYWIELRGKNTLIFCGPSYPSVLNFSCYEYTCSVRRKR